MLALVCLWDPNGRGGAGGSPSKEVRRQVCRKFLTSLDILTTGESGSGGRLATVVGGESEVECADGHGGTDGVCLHGAYWLVQ